MFGAILGALKGIGSGIASGAQYIGRGIGKGFQNEGGEPGFNWDKLFKTTEAFGQGMGPQSGVGHVISNVGHSGQVIQADRANKRVDEAMTKAKEASGKRPVSTITAEEAGIGGELTPPKAAAAVSGPTLVIQPPPPMAPPPSMQTASMAPPPSAVTAAPSSSLKDKVNQALGTGLLDQPEQKVYAPEPELIDPMAIPELQPMIPLDLPDVEFDPETGYVRRGGRPLAY